MKRSSSTHRALVRSALYFMFLIVYLLIQVTGAEAARVSEQEVVAAESEKELTTPPRSQPTVKPKEITSQPKAAVSKSNETRAQRPSVKKIAQKRPEPRFKPQPQAKPIQKESQEKSVTIDFDNVDLLLFIKFISEVTGKNFIVDRKVKGNVTIISPTKISVDEAYRVFESVLEVHGFTTIEAGEIVKIVPSTVARGKNIETRLREEAITPEDRVVTQLIRLDYANPDELKKLFAPLISKSSVIISYPPSGMLIVTDVLSNIQRLMRIIDTIDVVGVGEEVSIIPIEYATATILSKTLTTIFQTTSRTTRTRGQKSSSVAAPGLKIVADERTNSLILIASEHDTLRIKQLIKILDRETPRGAGNIRVHYLQHADAEELAKVLTNLPSDKGKTAKKGKAPVTSKEVQIVADKATNSLVITGSKQDYQAIMDVVNKLDIPRPMVYIEVLIMEVSTDKSFNIGVNWQGADDIGSYDGRAVGAFAKSGTAGIELTSTALTLGIVGEAITIGGISYPTISAVVQAFQSDSDVHILQTPQLLTTDNEEAQIDVVTNKAFLTKSATGDQEYDAYEYKDVGSKLKITPQINQNRFVRLEIEQEYSTFSGTGEGDKPETFKRTAKTTVVVKDNDTVVIGGLVGEQISVGTAGVPCLGSIPLIGWLFKSYSRTRDETNLFIFLTPHVIENPAEAEDLYKEKRQTIDKLQEGVIKMYETPTQQDDETLPDDNLSTKHNSNEP